MKSITWKPGSNKELDSLFNQCRLEQYTDRTHRLWENYSVDMYKDAVALTICFNDQDYPEMCSTIAVKNCWPVGCYRILNRLWKHSNKIKFPRVMSPSFAESAKSQIAWLAQNTNCELYFISRQTDNWEEWVIKNFQEVYGVGFKTDNYKYLTCPNECDDTCWQKIIYNGNEQLLTQWKQKTL
jgi:hypothetical protein